MLGLGKSLVRESAVNSYAQRLAYAFSSRVKQDGGLVESVSCLISSLKDLITGPDSLLIDRYASPAAAYSLRKLRRDYLGPAIRVRRDSDDEELDIFFDSAGNLDTASLDTFCAGTHGYVDTWYDQANGNDATQDDHALQPNIYYSTYDNALLHSNQFDVSPWATFVFNDASLTRSSGYADPEGTSNAYKLELVVGTGGALLTNEVTVVSGADYTLSVWMKGESGGEKVRLALKNKGSDGPSGDVITLTTEWTRYDVTLTADGADRGLQFRLLYNDGASDQTIYVYGAQLETGDTATDYVETTTAPAVRMGYVVTENGKPALEFDGVNDNIMSVNNVSSQNITMVTIANARGAMLSMIDAYNDGHELFYSSNTAIMLTNATDLIISESMVSQHLVFATYDGSTQKMAIDSSESTQSLTTTLSYSQPVTIGQRSQISANFLIGKVQEVLVYESDQSSNRTGIETNINDYYNIY